MNFDLANINPHHRYNLMIGLIAPRPIALVTSQDREGRLNAAPFSAYNYLSIDPPIIALGVANPPGGQVAKDTAQNIRATREFVVHVVNEAIAEKMNLCAIDFPQGESEVDLAGFTTVPSTQVKVPRLAEAPAALACREIQTTEIGNGRIILGQVVAIHVQDEFLDPAGPYIRADQLHAIGRMNGLGAYVRTRDAFFQMKRVTYAEWREGKSKK